MKIGNFYWHNENQGEGVLCLQRTFLLPKKIIVKWSEKKNHGYIKKRLLIVIQVIFMNLHHQTRNKIIRVTIIPMMTSKLRKKNQIVIASKKNLKLLITPELAAVLDRTKVSDRQSTFIIGATVKSLGKDINFFACSHTTIKLHREKMRQEMASFIK